MRTNNEKQKRLKKTRVQIYAFFTFIGLVITFLVFITGKNLPDFFKGDEGSMTKQDLTAEDFYCERVGNEIHILKYKGSNNIVNIPDRINGYYVTSIGDDAFYKCESIFSVTVPDTIESIGLRAFYECYELTEVILSKRLKTIGEFAFFNCRSLTDIEIPNNVASIGGDAFAYCSSLSSIGVNTDSKFYSTFDGALYDYGETMLIQAPSGKTGVLMLPKTTRVIIPGALSWCYNISSLEVANGNVYLISKDGIVYSNDYRTLICCPPGMTGSVLVDEKTTTIGKLSFLHCSNISSIMFSEVLVTIKEQAFWYCGGITSIILPQSVVAIESNAFGGCEQLLYVYFEGNAPNVGQNVFWETSDLLTIYYKSKASGFTGLWCGKNTAIFDD